MRARANRRAGSSNGGGTSNNSNTSRTSIGQNNCTLLTIAILNMVTQRGFGDGCPGA
jgi:hypothetical protein